MKHNFVASALDADKCQQCQYDERAHTGFAICEACGAETLCDLFPDTKHPKKMLLCAKCIKAEYDTAARQTQERVKAHEKIQSPADYFNADIPSIVTLKATIDNDPSIENKTEALAVAVKNHHTHLQDRLLSLRKEITETDHERRETLIYLNHLMKDISEAKQAALGLTTIKYQPPTKKSATKKQTAPTTKKLDKEELRKVANMFHIDEAVLRSIVVRRNVSVEAAAKIYIDASNKVGD